MTALEKAVLEELDKKGQPVNGSAVPVQFNPTSLKLQMTNSIDGAASRGRQAQQYNGSSSTSLTVQLEFDTADEGSTGTAGGRADPHRPGGPVRAARRGRVEAGAAAGPVPLGHGRSSAA